MVGCLALGMIRYVACRRRNCSLIKLTTYSYSVHLTYWEKAYVILRKMIIIYLFTAILLSPGGSGYFTCKQNTKLVTNKFKSGGLHEKHVVATLNVGNRLSICL